MVTNEQLDALIMDILRDAKQARDKGDNRYAHGLDEAASQIEKLIPTNK